VSADVPETSDGSGWTRRSLPTRLEVVREVEREVISRLAEFGYDEDHRFAIRLAFEEAIINAMKHGNRMEPDRQVRLAYRISPDQAEIRIADEGLGFDPGGVPDPTRDENLRRPCGRGIMLIRAYMDEVSFSSTGSEICMVKYHRRGRTEPRVQA